jgi:hypothetical protein
VPDLVLLGALISRAARDGRLKALAALHGNTVRVKSYFTHTNTTESTTGN